MSNQSPFYAAIAGNIGVGKTTLTQTLAQEFGWFPYYEKVVENPYLIDFYNNMQRWSFHSQIYFLTQRLKDHRCMMQTAQPCVQDRTLYEDAEIFTRILHKQGNMSDRDFQNYQELFQSITALLRKPDLIVYLNASVWTLISRIRKRGRNFEKNISKEYLYELNTAYGDWINRIKDRFTILTINADAYDFEENQQSIHSILESIKTILGNEKCQALGIQ